MSTLHLENLKGPTTGANANKVIIPTGQTLQIDDGVAHASMPSGSVIQVVHNTYSTSVHITTTSYTATGLQATITPRQQNSKILVQVNQHLRFQSAYDQGVGFQLKNGSTVLYQSATQYDEYLYDGDSTAEIHMRGRRVFEYMDTHNSTNAITYQVFMGPYRQNYTSHIYAQNDTNQSQITCWEIAQ